MTGFKLFFVVLCAQSILGISAELSDKRLCANEACTVPISTARTKVVYNAGEKGMLSFPPNVEVTIFSKSAGSNKGLWGAEYKGNRGYIPNFMIQEKKVYTSNLPYIVNTEYANSKVPSDSATPAVNVEPNKPVVVDGTTIIDYDIVATSATKEATVAATSTSQIVGAHADANRFQNLGNIPTEAEKKPDGNEMDLPTNAQNIQSNEAASSVTNKAYAVHEDDDEDEDEDDDGEYVDDEDSEDDDDEFDFSDSPADNNQANNSGQDANKLVEPEHIPSEATKDSTNDNIEKIETENSVINTVNNLYSALQSSASTADGTDKTTQEKPVTDESNLVKSEPISTDEFKSAPTIQIADGKQETVVQQTNFTLNTSAETNEGGIINSVNEEVTDKLTVEFNSAPTIQVADGKQETVVQQTNDTLKTSVDANKGRIVNSVNEEVTENVVHTVTEHQNVDKTENPQVGSLNANENLVDSNLKVNENSVVDSSSVTENPLTGSPKISEKPMVEGPKLSDNPILHNVEVNEIPAFGNLKMTENPLIASLKRTESLKSNVQNAEVPENPTAPNVDESENTVSRNGIAITENSITQNTEAITDTVNHASTSAINPVLGALGATGTIQTPNTDPKEENITENLIEDSKPTSDNNAAQVPVYTDTKKFGDIPPVPTTTVNQQEFGYNNIPPLTSTENQPKFENENIPTYPEKEQDFTLNGITEAYGAVSDNNGSISSNEIVSNDKQNEQKSQVHSDDNTSQNEEQGIAEAAEQQGYSAEEEAVEDGNGSPGFFGYLLSFIGGNGEEPVENSVTQEGELEFKEGNDDVLLSRANDYNSCLMDESQEYCTNQEKPQIQEIFAEALVNESDSSGTSMDVFDIIKLLGVSGATIVIFLWGYIIIDKMRKEGPLIAKINNLEKALLVSAKENQILGDKLNDNECHSKDDSVHNADVIEELRAEVEVANNARICLEEQLLGLEKELENSTEVGLELNRMLTEVLSSQNGSDTLMANIEQLQSKLVEQQATINTINATLNDKDTENHELQLELEINNKKVIDLQSELDKMVLNLIKLEEEKDHSQMKYETQLVELRDSKQKLQRTYSTDQKSLSNELSDLKKRLSEAERNLELKVNEYNLLKDSMCQSKNNTDIKSLLDLNSIKAEMQQLQREKASLTEHLQQTQQIIANFEKQVAVMAHETGLFRQQYEQADREKLQALTKLEVLNSYFKEKEAELQKELAKQESLWSEKRGEANSTTERIKFMQGEIQNFKVQNESLKQEIVSQEVELKSQISVLEKKAHENWVAARQAERKFEDARQEASQLRNRLTLRERSLIEDKSQNRLQSPLESNGDHTLSPMHIGVDSPASPPLIYGTRDHITTSPPIPGLPFLPPPPGVPFMPPPPGMPPFMPPPLSMYPGDHRPPPLGRMSSPPPLNSRYSPESRPYTPYDRNSPSPTDDEYYGISRRGYSPYNGRDVNRERDKREYARPMQRPNMRNIKGAASSGSANSNESLEKINRHNSKV